MFMFISICAGVRLAVLPSSLKSVEETLGEPDRAVEDHQPSHKTRASPLCEEEMKVHAAADSSCKCF